MPVLWSSSERESLQSSELRTIFEENGANNLLSEALLPSPFKLFPFKVIGILLGGTEITAAEHSPGCSFNN